MSRYTSEVLQELADAYIDLAKELRRQNRQRFFAGEVPEEDYEATKDKCRQIRRDAMLLLTAASSAELNALSEHLKALDTATDKLVSAREDITRINGVLGVALRTVTSLVTIAAAIAAPSPTSIAAAVRAVGETTAAIGQASQR